MKDKIQDIVIKRAEQLGLTSYAIAQMTEGQVSEDHIRKYLTHRNSMGSHKLQHVIRAVDKGDGFGWLARGLAAE